MAPLAPSLPEILRGLLRLIPSFAFSFRISDFGFRIYATRRLGSLLALLLAGFSSLCCPYARADDTFVYAVQISAALQTNPPRITLNWEPDPYGADSYTVYRKSKAATDWGAPVAVLDGSYTSWVDSNVAGGSTYEYQIIKQASLGYTGYGYIFSGIEAPLIENRGRLLLVVAAESTVGLSGELARLQGDLVGDGWLVSEIDVSTNDSPESVRAAIINAYDADPANVDAVFLFGHVPILQSGYLNYDGHYYRAMPADSYYGEMNPDWPTFDNPTNGPSYLPSDVALMVGRVDFFNMPGVGASVPWPSETELLRNYLNKDHNWRLHLLTVPRLALMGDCRGAEDGPLAMAASGYRNFEPLVGPGNTIQADTDDDAPIPQIWSSMLGSGSYLWAFGDGGGQANSISWLGTNPPYNLVLSTDLVGEDAHVVFAMMFGSFFGNWDDTDNIMRSVLATPTTGLACCLAGEPHWFFHHMGLGETIGYGTRLTMNNSTLYQNMSNVFTRAVYIALMGDPSLRQDSLAPPSNLSATAEPSSVGLNWSPSADPVLGYYVYRASSPAGPFARLTASLVPGTSFTDASPPAGPSTYTVRAVNLETTPSGSYYNASEGIFATTTSNPNPLTLVGHLVPNGFLLTWNSGPGITYRVLAAATLLETWQDVSGTLTATGATSSWTDTTTPAHSQRFYRVASP